MKKNILANILGRFWGILSNFLFIPLYIKFLGFESYSVISFTFILVGLMLILDGGLTATLLREFSRKDKDRLNKISIFKTLESFYFILSLVGILLVIVFSNYIANHWINTDHIEKDELSIILKIFGVELGFQLLFRFYMGGLLGLEKQVKANVYQLLWGICRNALVVVVIYYYPSLEVFIIWQAVSTILFTLFLRMSLLKSFDLSRWTFSFEIDKKIIKDIGGFAGGMLLIAIVSAVNTQLDKLTISKFLDIENLGYYTLAVSLSQGLVLLVNPLLTAILPTLTGLFSENKVKESLELIKNSGLFISILVFSFLSHLIINSEKMIWIWTGNVHIAQEASPLLKIISVAYAMIALQMLPYNVAIANGYTKINNVLGIISLFVIIPGYFIFIQKYQSIGGAYVFCIIQIVTMFLYAYLINNKFMKFNYLFEIIIKQIFIPIVIISLITFVFSLIPIFLGKNRIFELIWIGFGVLLNLAISLVIFYPIAKIKTFIKKR